MAEPAWFAAIRSGDVALLRRTVTRANVNDLTIGGSTALHLAADSANPAIVRTLLSAGADVAALDEDSWACTHNAALKGCPEVMLMLLDAGAPVDVINSSGRSPLSLALWTVGPWITYTLDHQVCARLLLEFGAQLARARGAKPKWARMFTAARAACHHAAVVVIGIGSLQRSPHFLLVGRDVARLIGRRVWHTRVHPTWDNAVHDSLFASK